jgi:acyl-CoA synthetase (AMP-forming)/AMP-acid ligase II
MLGGTVTTVNPLYTVRELADQLQDADARYLLTVPPFLANARAAAAQSSVRELFVLGEADVAVIGRPDTEAGEVPIAFAVIKRDVTARELLDFVAERVAPYKRLHDVAFVTQIPKSPTGKILRRVLIEQERAPRHTAYGG